MTPSRTLLALGLLGGAGVGLELTLTRLVSALHGATYVYLALSVALLGLGLGAALLSVRPTWRARPVGWAALACVSTLALTTLLLRVAGPPLPLLLVAASVPFVFVGAAVTAVFAQHPQRSATLYWADLSGAGLGALLAPPLMNTLSVPGAALAAALAFGGAGALLTRTHRGAFAVGTLTCGAGLVGVAASTTGLAALEPWAFADKPLGTALAAGGEIVRTRWDALARTDLIYHPQTGGYALYMDGGAGSVVPDLNRPERWEGDIGSFPFLSSPPERTFLLGPGGGLDVALAKAHGAGGLEAAELNGAALDLVQSLAPQVGDLYAGVRVVREEGRRALQRGLQRGAPFDLIFLSHVITGAAELRTQSLSENVLYTTGAFHTYLDRLTPTGQVALKLYDEATLTRALMTALQVLSERGHAEAAALTHLVALLDTRGERPVPLLLVRNAPVSRDEAIRLGRLAEGRGYGLLLLPHLLYPPTLAGLARGEETLAEVLAGAQGALRPATDDRPFFFLFGAPPRTLLALPLVTGGLLAGLLLLARRPFRRAPPPLTGGRGGLLFAALGVGFMLTQVFVLQRSQLVIGGPTQTLSWVLATLLVSSGLGSYVVARRGWPLRLQIGGGTGLIALLLLAWGALVPYLSTASLLVSLVPLGFALGIPFAAALRPLTPPQVALAWALSGVGSVLGSTAALALALHLGYHTVWWAGLGLYGLVGLLGALPTARGHRTPSDPSTHPDTQGARGGEAHAS